MRAWVALFALLWLGPALAKRVDPLMVDPLARRSALDRNFMRFGRSSPPYEADEGGGEEVDLARFGRGKQDFVRFGRGKQDFMRFGRGKQDFMRFGRGKQDFMRFGRGKQDFMRFGRGKQDFMRFGRGKQDGFVRFGRIPPDDVRDLFRSSRGKQDSFMRFGRTPHDDMDHFLRPSKGKQDSFMRFGRTPHDDVNHFLRPSKGKQDSFMRFGRTPQEDLVHFLRPSKGKQDSFMRFGRTPQDDAEDFSRFGKENQDSFMRFAKKPLENSDDMFSLIVPWNDTSAEARENQDGFMMYGEKPGQRGDTSFDKSDGDFKRAIRAKQDRYMRFGKGLSEDSEKNIPLAMRSASNVIRFGRAKPDNFIRFGKSDGDFFSEQASNVIFTPQVESLEREKKSKNKDSLRSVRKRSSNDNSFIRYGKRSSGRGKDSTSSSRLEEMNLSSLQNDKSDLIDESITNLKPDDSEDEYTQDFTREECLNRIKRSLNHDSATLAPHAQEDPSTDYVARKLHLDSSTVPELQSSLLSAGIPNVIVGPEFSLLPDLNPPPSMMKSKTGDKSFLRLG